MKPRVSLTKWALFGLCSVALTSPAPMEAADAKIGAAMPATFTDVPYGEHSRQTMDVWQARSEKPAPLVLYFHGGGWQAGGR